MSSTPQGSWFSSTSVITLSCRTESTFWVRIRSKHQPCPKFPVWTNVHFWSVCRWGTHLLLEDKMVKNYMKFFMVKNNMKLLTNQINVWCWWLFCNALYYEERPFSRYLAHLFSNRNPLSSHIPSLIQYSQTSLAVMEDHSTDDLDKPNDSFQTLLSLARRISCLQALEPLFLSLRIRTKKVALVHPRYKASRKYKNRLFKEK